MQLVELIYDLTFEYLIRRMHTLLLNCVIVVIPKFQHRRSQILFVIWCGGRKSHLFQNWKTSNILF